MERHGFGVAQGQYQPCTLAVLWNAGPPGMVAGTRELTPHRSYRIIYEVGGDMIWILVVIHTARQWPPLQS